MPARAPAGTPPYPPLAAPCPGCGDGVARSRVRGAKLRPGPPGPLVNRARAREGGGAGGNRCKPKPSGRRGLGGGAGGGVGGLLRDCALRQQNLTVTGRAERGYGGPGRGGARERRGIQKFVRRVERGPHGRGTGNASVASPEDAVMDPFFRFFGSPGCWERARCPEEPRCGDVKKFCCNSRPGFSADRGRTAKFTPATCAMGLHLWLACALVSGLPEWGLQSGAAHNTFALCESNAPSAFRALSAVPAPVPPHPTQTYDMNCHSCTDMCRLSGRTAAQKRR